MQAIFKHALWAEAEDVLKNQQLYKSNGIGSAGEKMITSVGNQKVKQIVQWNKKPSLRNREGVFVAEGLKMFSEVPQSSLKEIYIADGFLEGIRKTERSRDIWGKLEECGYETVSEEVFSKMSDICSPQGILFVARQMHYTFEQMAEASDNPLFLVLEDIQDPGNLGTMIRTGEGAGISGVIMSKGTADIYNPKTIRSTMGSVYRVPFLYAEDFHATVRRLREYGVMVYAAHLRGEKCYDEFEYRRPTAFLIGNEGNGLTEETAELADTYVRIPMEGRLESLNAAIASALLLYEAAGQRRRGA